MVELVAGNKLFVRTYERGVEEETYACGTGAIASSLISASLGKVKSPVTVKMKGGDLIVRFDEINGVYRNVTLTGKATFVYEGRFQYNEQNI